MDIIYYATTINFGPGAIDGLAAHCAQLGIKRPLVVTDTGLSKTEIPQKTLHLLSGLQCRLFDRINPNPVEAEVLSGVQAYHELDADGIVALGGGSAIDGAKAIGLLVSNGGPLASYVGLVEKRRAILRELPPIIAIPTISGSGSEISRGLGVGVGASGTKASILHPRLFPKVALCDPTLTLSVPRETSVLSAVDALSHCLEAMISPVYNPPIHAVARDGAARLFRNLDLLFSKSDDLEVRKEIMMGSIEGGMAMPKGLGPAHGIGIPLDRLHISHGAIIARLLPKVIRWYGAALNDKAGDIRAALELREHEDIADALERFNARLGILGGLESIGVPRDVVADISVEAANSPYAGICIRDASQKDYFELLSSAM